MKIFQEGNIYVLNKNAKETEIIKTICDSKLQENPFHVLNINDIIQKWKLWESLLPNVEPYYSVKCNNHPIVLKVLAALGSGFDCSSQYEMDQVLSLGVHPDRIAFAHTTKIASHIRHAVKVKVDFLTFDSEFELEKIKEIYPHARTIIRIKCDAKHAFQHLSMKFGCDPTTEAPKLLQAAQKLGINVVGVSFHVGSNCRDDHAFYNAIEDARRIFDLANKYSFKFNLLDLGGGFPGEKSSKMITEYAASIKNGLEQFFPGQSVRVISEPGRYFVESALTLACNIHSAKIVHENDLVTNNAISKHMYFLNDGIFGNFYLAHSHASKSKFVPGLLKNYNDAVLHWTVLWGPTCAPFDKICEGVLLPKLDIGDWLVFENMGSYTKVFSSNFNSFEQADVFPVISLENLKMIQSKSKHFTEKIVFLDDNII